MRKCLLRILFILFIVISGRLSASAQSLIKQIHFPDSLKSRHIVLHPQLQLLNCTHWTEFYGCSLEGYYTISRILELGVGTEYSTGKFHKDNGMKLYHLHFFPMHLSTKINFLQLGKLYSFIHLDEGICFDSYTRFNPNSSPESSVVHQQGFYVYSGGGLFYKISDNFAPSLEIGFKGFHNSLNKYDINPHGFTVRAGVLL